MKKARPKKKKPKASTPGHPAFLDSVILKGVK